MPFGFQEALSFDSGHAARSGRGNRLAVSAILHIARVEYAFDAGACAAM